MNQATLIVHIITGLNTGGAEMMLYKICKYKSDNIRYKIFSLTTKGPIADKIEELGIEVSAVNLNKNPFSLFNILKLIKDVRKLKPKYIQTWMYHSDFIGTIVSLFTRIPVIWNIRQASVNVKLNKTLTVIISRLCAKLSFIPIKILSCTQAGINEHAKIGYDKSKMQFVPNGFETEEFTPKEHHNVKKKIIHVGRFAPLKNHTSFMEIARAIHEEFPDCEFYLYGDDVDSTNIILTSRLGITPFHLEGRNTNLKDIYAESDLLISTSLSEGFSNTIGEALSCGCTVITTDVGDSAIIVDDPKNTFKPHQESEIARRAIELLKNPTSPSENREKITSRFKIQDTVKQYESIYLS
jgi:glycosyltransferase involved in cell wall biosynthesis